MHSGRLVFLLALSLLAQQPRDVRVQRLPQPVSADAGSQRFALVIGISRYRNLPPEVQLRYADRDAREFASFLASPIGGSIPPRNIQLLTDEHATLASIRGALHHWLPGVAGPGDIAYVFFAGHGVMAEQERSYFVAHDSDPQNLHATGLSFEEVDRTLSDGLRAKLTILAMDACHGGRLGWSTYQSSEPNRAAVPLASLGRGDRSFLKLLASRPSERSFESEEWGGGHGIFTQALLEGVRGAADTDADGSVRAAELIDYLGRTVPERTRSQQNPRIAGTFDPRLVLATASSTWPPIPTQAPPDEALPKLRTLIAQGQVLDPGGAWDFYRTRQFSGRQGAAAKAAISTALEELGQACVNDYVQSSTVELKKPMLARASAAWKNLQALLPEDRAVATRALFCEARLQIANRQFEPAVQLLRKSLQLDEGFACAHNALGVALGNLGRHPEARSAFERAAALTPEWGLPPFQLAQQLLSAGDAKGAIRYLEQALRLSPNVALPRWHLLRAYRSLRDWPGVEREAAELIRRNPHYAPLYLEVARAYEELGDPLKAAAAYETYLILAPNFADSDEIRDKVKRYRAPQPKRAPTLRRPGEK